MRRPVPPSWLPNAISSLRIAMVPCWLLAAEGARADGVDTGRLVALGLLLAIGVSDVVDGWLARRFGLATRTGAVLDAFADKLAQVVVLGWLALRGGVAGFVALPAWFLVLLVARDVVLGCGWTALRLRHGTVAVVHHAHGKIASVLLFVLGVLLHVLPGASDDGADAWLDVALAPLAAFVAASTALYVRDGWAQRHGPAGPA